MKHWFVYLLFPEEETKADCYSPQFDGDNLGSSSSCYSGNPISNPQNVSLSASKEQCSAETQEKHKVMICSKDVYEVTPEAFGSSGQVKLMPQNHREQKISVADVMCSSCKQLLFHPVVLNCGHGIYTQHLPLISKILRSLIENLIG